MKNKLTAILLVTVLALSLAACGGDSGGGDAKAYTAEKPLVFKISHPDSESNVHQSSFLAFEKFVEEQTGGTVDVQIYPNGVLGGDQEVLQMIAMNEVQLCEVGTSVLCTFDDKFGILDLPYLFTSYEVMDEAVQGGLGELYNSWLPEYGFMGMGFMWDGSKTISNNVRPINTVADMKGLKIRITDAEIYVRTLKALGANPTPMSWGDIYTGLQQGTVDGMDVPAISTYSNGWNEAIKYWSLTNEHMSNCALIANDSFMKGLPEDIYTALTEGAKTYLVKQDRENARKAELDSIDAMAAAGVAVNEVENIQEFADAVTPVYDFYRELLGDEIMDQVEDFRK